MDYSRIRGMESGQRLAFEELICQLAHLERPAADAEFRRIEGAGGDGGIEAYWLLNDESEIGYQAKYYLKSSEIDWANIDESVEQALAIHPALSKYVVALPCDLTDRTGRQGKGKTGWEHWATHKAKWEKLVPAGNQVEFVAWTAAIITERMIRPNAEGLRSFWFGDIELSQKWFQDKLNLAIESLEERYHPEDHVEVSIERMFRIALRDKSIASEILENIGNVIDTVDLESIQRQLGPESKPITDKIGARVNDLATLSLRITADSWAPWPIDECIKCANDISESSYKLYDIKRKVDAATPKTRPEHDQGTSHLEHQIGKINSKTYALSSLLDSNYFLAEKNRTILLYGKAGTGKSHLLGSIAQQATAQGRKAILILGQHLNADNLWRQIATRLELGDVTADAFLQTFSAAAEATGKPSLLLVDAINEGAGRTLWHRELAGFLGKVGQYENIVLVVSCRSEYRKAIISESLLEKLPSFEVRGFETAKEQSRAAKTYLAKRGISHPNTPWLSAEFVNPLFLRSTCIALEKENKKFFPQGLTGTKEIFVFYIKSIARNLGVGQDGTDTLVKPTTQAISAIALEMAAQRRDYVPESEAIRIVADKFRQHPCPADSNWLGVLQRNGLFRIDPGCQSTDDDLLNYSEDIVRFSFQRLQDHLMAEVLLKNSNNPADALKTGSLSFIHDDEQINWQWTGLAAALSIQIPERFGEELLDVLPGEINDWASDYDLRDSFMDSLKWRNSKSFTARTLEIYKAFQEHFHDYFDILIQLAASSDHPCNALHLHKELKDLKMANRDKSWTRQVNGLSMEEGSAATRLIEWSAHEQNEHIDPKIQYLCALTLTWFTSSSFRELRDKSTKAISSLFRRNPGLYKLLCEDFRDVDDLYIHERLHAAAYGACCIDPSKERLAEYAKTAYSAVFDREVVPASIALRDSALGIIELAHLHTSMPTGVDMLKARPPYGTKSIRLSVSEDMLKKVATKAGDSQISRSCTGWVGDFGKYEIQPRIQDFLNILLTKPEPFTASEIQERFEQEVINHSEERVRILKIMHEVCYNPYRAIISFYNDQDHESLKEDENKKLDESLDLFNECEALLLSELTQKEKVRYRKEYKPRFANSESRPKKLPHIDVNAAQRWVAKRAYSYGWTEKLFPRDRSFGHTHGRSRATGERIGKKYQWMALDELLCSLADNNWMSEKASHGSRRFAGRNDIRFHRDIDPTLLLTDETATIPGNSIQKHEIILHRTPENELGKWPFEADPSERMKSLIYRNDSEGRKWAALHEHRSISERYKDSIKREHGLRKEEWRYLLPIIVRKQDEQTLIRYLRKQRNVEVDHWSTRDSTNSGYLLEAPWRSTWEQGQWSTMDFYNIGQIEIAYPCYRYYWESHQDASLPDGAQALIPAPWLARRLGLKPHPDDPNVYLDRDGSTCFVSGKSPHDGSHAFIDQNLFDSFLAEDGLSCVWVFVAERAAWPGGGNADASWRRSEGYVWLKKGKPQMHHWNDDTDKGDTGAEFRPETEGAESSEVDESND